MWRLAAFSHGDKKDRDFSLSVGREKVRHIVIEERETRCAEVLSIRGEIHLAAQDAGFELPGPISTIAESSKDGVEIGEEKDTGCGITG
jgi:hypothetical protein